MKLIKYMKFNLFKLFWTFFINLKILVKRRRLLKFARK